MSVVRAKKNHGYSKTRLYGVWIAMKRRCYNPNVEQYKNYGARGIKMCDAWKHDFIAFRKWAIQNGYDEAAKFGECTIDRIDTNGDYKPENCRWVNLKTQENNRLNNRKIKIGTETKTLSEWEDYSGIKQATIRYRVENCKTKNAISPLNQQLEITANGETHSVKEWANILGISSNALYKRIKRGLKPEEAVLKQRRKLEVVNG